MTSKKCIEALANYTVLTILFQYLILLIALQGNSVHYETLCDHVLDLYCVCLLRCQYYVFSLFCSLNAALQCTVIYCIYMIDMQ